MLPDVVAEQAYIGFFQINEVIYPSNVNFMEKLPRFILEKAINKRMDNFKNLTNSTN